MYYSESSVSCHLGYLRTESVMLCVRPICAVLELLSGIFYVVYFNFLLLPTSALCLTQLSYKVFRSCAVDIPSVLGTVQFWFMSYK